MENTVHAGMVYFAYRYILPGTLDMSSDVLAGNTLSYVFRTGEFQLMPLSQGYFLAYGESCYFPIPPLY